MMVIVTMMKKVFTGKNNMVRNFKVIRDNKVWIKDKQETFPFYQAFYDTLKSLKLKVVERNTFNTKEGLLEVFVVEEKK